MLIRSMYCGYSPPRDDYLHVYTGKVSLVRPGINQILSLLAPCSLLVQIIHHAVMCTHVPILLYNMNDVKSINILHLGSSYTMYIVHSNSWSPICAMCLQMSTDCLQFGVMNMPPCLGNTHAASVESTMPPCWCCVLIQCHVRSSLWLIKLSYIVHVQQMYMYMAEIFCGRNIPFSLTLLVMSPYRTCIMILCAPSVYWVTIVYTYAQH